MSRLGTSAENAVSVGVRGGVVGGVFGAGHAWYRAGNSPEALAAEEAYLKTVRAYHEYVDARKEFFLEENERIVQENPSLLKDLFKPSDLEVHSLSERSYMERLFEWRQTPSLKEQYIELRARQIALEQNEKLAQLKKEYEDALEALEKHHEELVRTTTRAGTAVAETDGYQSGRRGGYNASDTTEVSETHDHDPQYFDLVERVKKAQDAYKDELATTLPVAREEALGEIDGRFPPLESPGGFSQDWDALFDQYGGPLETAGEWALIGGVGFAVLAGALTAITYRRY